MIFNHNVSSRVISIRDGQYYRVHMILVILYKLWYNPYEMDHILSEFDELEKSAQNLFIQYNTHVSIRCTCEKITCTSDCLYFCALFYKRKEHDWIFSQMIIT